MADGLRSSSTKVNQLKAVTEQSNGPEIAGYQAKECRFSEKEKHAWQQA